MTKEADFISFSVYVATCFFGGRWTLKTTISSESKEKLVLSHLSKHRLLLWSSSFMPVDLPLRDLKDLACLPSLAKLPFFFFDLAAAGTCPASTSEDLILPDLTISLLVMTSLVIDCPGWWLAQRVSLQFWSRSPSFEVGPLYVDNWFSRALA